MKKKVLFISANTFKEPYPVYPLGVSYLSTYLRESMPGIQIKILDRNLCTLEEIAKEISSFNPGIIGVSLRNADNVDSTGSKSFISGYKEIVDLIRESCNATLVIGGAAFSVFPEKIFQELKPDFGIIGEGEKSLVELIQLLDKNEDPGAIEGLVFN